MAGVSSKQFGGGWSDDKLDALHSYLASYLKALSKAPFERVYIDAFAGAGIRTVAKSAEEGLFDEQLAEEDAGYRHGSPLIALGMDPPFHKFIFIEQDSDSLAALRIRSPIIFQKNSNAPGSCTAMPTTFCRNSPANNGESDEPWRFWTPSLFT